MTNFLSLFLILPLVFSAVIDRPRKQPSFSWVAKQRSNPKQPIKLVLAVHQRNTDKIRDKLLEVSTPGNHQYGNFLDRSEIWKMLAPHPKALLSIRKWLSEFNITENDITSETPNSDILSFTTTIEKAEKILGCEYYDYKHVTRKDVVSRVKMGSDYHVPESVMNHLDFISPTHRFPVYSTLRKTEVRASSVTPKTLHDLYNTHSTVGKATGNSVSIASFQFQYYQMSDLKTFWKDYDVDETNVTNVPSNQGSGAHLEAELDTQYMSAMSQKVPMQVWYTGGNFENALLEWSVKTLEFDPMPLLASVSYGTSESYYGVSYTDRLDTNIAAMGTAGISVLFASGDSGAGGGCSRPPFEPDYPASSPYVTAVGGVTGGEAGKSPTGETVWVDGGGGFSNFNPVQSWQSSAVAKYLTNSRDLPSSSDFNSSGRGYPDISAQSVDFIIVANGRKEGVSGTSCASPTAGGVFGLLNDLRLYNGMSPMGFLNPFIYQTAESDSSAFNDVTSGYNKGCGASKGFEASSLWDAASGWGSPNYSVLSKYVLQTGQSTKRSNKKN